VDADLFTDDVPARSRWRERLAAWHPRQWLGTLKLRLAAGVLVALLAGMAWSAWQMQRLAADELLAQAQVREQREAQRTVAVIGRRLAELQRALARVAAQMPPALVADPARLEAFLVGQPVLLSAFHYVNVAGRDGRLLISVDDKSVSWPKVSIADRPHFRRALTERRAQISQPLPGRVAGEPVVVFAQPLLADGEVHAVLLGVLRLASRDLLADLAEARSDDDGTIVVITDDHGTILAHPQRAMVLRSLADEPRLASAYLQWEAEARPLQRDAGHWQQAGEVVAMGGEGVAGWHVWRAAPRAQQLAPLADAAATALRRSAGIAAALAALLVGFLAWQLRPLRQLERRAQRLLHADGHAGADDDWPVADGEIGRLARTLRHVWAERSQMEAFNTEVLAKLRSVMAAAPVGLCFTRHGRFELVSAQLCHLLGRSERDLVGQPTPLIFASNEDYLALGPQVAAAFARGEPYVGEWQMLRADGQVFWARLRGRPVDAADPGAGTIWSLNDISDQVQAREQLERAALHDALTGVANRKGFEAAMARVFAAPATQRPASVVMIDLDHFKPINDTAGHAAGDAMLVAVAQAIGGAVRTSDVVARLGGDEFAVLLPRCTQAQAVVVAEKVRKAIRDIALPWQGRTLGVGASLGVAELSDVHADPAQWLADADDACYVAKRSGRGAVRERSAALRLVHNEG
jgi:diguanylate cyclase (GGDEF)-like protein/PAS domain S-box-containing protein